jgi:hypothetical protein
MIPIPPPLPEIENKAKATPSRKINKCSEKGSVCVCVCSVDEILILVDVAGLCNFSRFSIEVYSKIHS